MQEFDFATSVCHVNTNCRNTTSIMPSTFHDKSNGHQHVAQRNVAFKDVDVLDVEEEEGEDGTNELNNSNDAQMLMMTVMHNTQDTGSFAGGCWGSGWAGV